MMRRAVAHDFAITLASASSGPEQLLFLAVASVNLQQQSPQPIGQILGRLIAPQQLFSNFLPNGLVPAAQVPDPDQRCLPGTIRVF